MERIDYACVLIQKITSQLTDALDKEIDYTQKTSHTDIVTKYDKMVEDFLCTELHKKFPEDSFFTEEETGRTISSSMWIIDPIDGTCNFTHQGFGYAISLAYYQNGEAVFGLVHDVERNILYKGIRGKGSFVNDKKLPMLSDTVDLNNCLYDVSYPAILKFKDTLNCDFSKISDDFLGHRACGSAALAICRVAEGTLGIYASFKLCVWDYAGAQVILEEVGGTCLNLDEDSFLIDDKKRPFFAASSENLMKKVFLIIR